ncbi:MAG: hypothetical protein ACJ74O_17185 [Frankiaceae bacterium]
MSEQIDATVEQLFERFVACAGAPDDEAAGQAADEALWKLEALLTSDEGAEPATR